MQRVKLRISRGFVSGYTRALNLFPTRKHVCASRGPIQDFKSLEGDWEKVGQAINRATSNYKTNVIRKQ